MSQNIFSLEGLISWLETQDPENTYSYVAPTRCVIFEYLKARGVPIISVTSHYWRDTSHQVHLGGTRELHRTAISFPHTYGAALQRARELLEEEHNAPPSS